MAEASFIDMLSLTLNAVLIFIMLVLGATPATILWL